MLSEAKHLSKKEAARFRRTLSRWYKRNGRDLPWRRTRDPYSILVSEVMLQQTQVASVIPYYKGWLRRFPSLNHLAQASESEVLHAWQGLGYYSRARNLHRAAKTLRKDYGGRFPTDLDALRALPGIGRYSANAIATFAFEHAVPIVEANTARLLARLFNLKTPIDSSEGRAALWKLAQSLLPKNSAHAHNSALLDVGALICTARTPKCSVCPVRKFCRASDPVRLPIKSSRPKQARLIETHVLSRTRHRVLLEQSHQRWRGLWILPSAKVDGFKPSSLRQPLYVSEFPFTHHRITLRVFRIKACRTCGPSQRWFSISELPTIPIPSPHRRALDELLNDS